MVTLIRSKNEVEKKMQKGTAVSNSGVARGWLGGGSGVLGGGSGVLGGGTVAVCGVAG